MLIGYVLARSLNGTLVKGITDRDVTADYAAELSRSAKEDLIVEWHSPSSHETRFFRGGRRLTDDEISQMDNTEAR